MKSKNNPNLPIIGIIGGQGRMGSLFADFFSSKNIEVLVSDIGTSLSNTDLAFQSDIVIVSVPIPNTKDVIQEVIPYLKPGALITDLTSIKLSPTQEMLKSHNEVLGMHPMFGNTNSLTNQRIIFCPARPAKWTLWLKEIFTSNQVNVEEMTPEDHDKAMALVQGLVHFSDITFAHTLKDLNIHPKDFLKFASPPSELKISFAARILAQDPKLYGSIQIYNDANIPTLKTYAKNIQKLLDINETKHLGAFQDYFQEAASHLSDYKDRALQETNWIIDRVLENRHKHQLSTGQLKNPATNPSPATDQVATLGPANTFSELTTREFLNNNQQLNSEPHLCSTITDAANLLAEEKVSLAIIPIENSTQGTVRETLDALLNYDLEIIAEIPRKIHHCLIGLEGSTINDAISIKSHPQALSQCKEFITKNLPNSILKETPSTAHALTQIIKENDPRNLAIASEEAATSLGLQVLASQIETTQNNQTNFIVLQNPNNPIQIQKPNQSNHPAPAQKTSIIFYFDANSPGILSDILNILASRNINLTKIESRPSQKSLGDYYFYIDFEGHKNSTSAQEALEEISQKVAELKILGSY